MYLLANAIRNASLQLNLNDYPQSLLFFFKSLASEKLTYNQLAYDTTRVLVQHTLWGCW